MSLRATALVTVAAAKAYCGIETAITTWDSILETLIDGVSEAFNRSCDRTLAKATYTGAYLDGPGTRELVLPNFPVISITSVEEDDLALTEGDEYDYLLYAESGILWRVGGDWLLGPKTVKITYTAGYIAIPGAGETESIPADLKLAALQQVAAEWQAIKNKSWGKLSDSGPDGASITRFESGQFLREVRQVLERYRRI